MLAARAIHGGALDTYFKGNKLASKFRENVNLWGAIIFGGMMTIGLGSEAYKYYTADSEPEAVVSAPVSTPAPRPAQNVATGPSAGELDALTARCVRTAISTGYRSAQCAHSFVDACVKTQSRQEMEKALKLDQMLQSVNSRSCPNMPTDYNASFAAEMAKADKF